jgi:hypothetical protein
MADFIIIDHVLDKYVDYSKCNCTKCGVKDNNVITDNKDNTVVKDKKDDNSEKKYDNFRNFSCIEKNENYCLIKNDDSFKVAVEIDSEHNYVLVVNDNRFISEELDYSAVITDLQFLYDGYIYVQFDVQGLGPEGKAYILDLNGNVVSKSTDIDYILNDGNYDRDAASIKFEDNKLFLSNTIFADGELGVVCSNKQFNTGWWPEYDQIVYVEYNYEYIGNGKISEISHVYKTFSERLNEQYSVSTCEELSNR